MTEPVFLHDIEQTLEAAQPKRYAAYPVYRPSGVDWLGDVPEHWEVKRLKFLAQLINEKVEADEDTDQPYIGMEHVQSWTGRLLQLNDDFVPNGISNVFQPGDILLGKLRPYLAKATAVDFKGLCSSELMVLRPNEVDRRFLLYALLSDGFIKLVDSSSYGAKMPRANWEFIGSMRTPVPSPDEQQTIARFLDEQTKKIDDLIEAKRDLVALLKEKRQAVISHAVTKGLNPDARLKPSGVDWLGEVPEHWEVKRLKFLAQLINEKVEADEDTDQSYIGMEHVQSWTGRLLQLNDDFVPNGISNVFQPGDILLGKLRPYLAKATAVDFKGLCSSELMVLRPNEVDRRFLLYALLSDGFIKLVDSSTYGAKMPRANWEFIGSMRTPVPSPDEQQAIARFLDEQTTKIDKVTQETITAIDRLTEYRTALISAAVTGKIDVRGGAA
jgi:restriction endonuclease S subunit